MERRSPRAIRASRTHSPSPLRAVAGRRAAALAVLSLLTTRALVSAQSPDPPRFRSSVDLTSVDVTVVDDKGKPILDLRPDEFTVRIDGSPRRVVAAEWTPLMTETGPPPPPPPEGYSTNDATSGGRLILFVVDQPNIRFGATLAIQRTLGEFIDRLQPSDRIAAVAIGPGNASTPFTADRERIKRAIARMSGTSRQFGLSDYQIAPSEAIDIRRGNPGALDRVMLRECSGQTSIDAEICRSEIQNQAVQMASDAEMNGETTLASLGALFRGLATIDAPKTLIFVSEGFPVEDQRAAVADLGRLAGLARTSLYALRLDSRTFDVSEPGLPVVPAFDRQSLVESLETLAESARGAMLNVNGSGASAFERIESELSGYYMIGVESASSDKDGLAHPIRVDVTRKGATVRSRRILKADTIDRTARTPRQAVASALTTPLPLSALPLRVGAFSLLGRERGRIQLLIHADIGSGYTANQQVALAYYITDANGRIVDSQSVDARLPPVMKGVPSPLQYVAGASLPPGDYVFKLAAVDGDKTGSVEHAFRAGVTEAGGVSFSDLMVGGPIDTRDLQQPTVGHLVSFGSVHGYVEFYGQNLSRLSTRFEVAATETGAALVDRQVAPYTVGDSRVIFSDVLSTQQLPPGRYVMRAVVSETSGEGPKTVQTLARAFEVAPPPVLMTSAGGLGLSSTPLSDLFLPVADEMFTRPFAKSDALAAPVLKAFRDRVGSAALPPFDQGIAAFTAGDYEGAETSLKNAVKVDADSTPLLAYLGATFASSGHDTDAAGAWQTALVDGSDMPELFVWLGDALLRTREVAQARTILEEAVSQWPQDARFAKPLALAYAVFGQGREAVRMLERHLAANPDDADALRMGVEWLYHLRVLGATAHSRAEDQKLAKQYADAYLKVAKGQQAALVRQWMRYMESGR